MKLTTNELNHITGGGISFGLALSIVSGLVFVAGLISGYFNPKKCNIE